MSNAKIASEVGLSASACLRRIQMLEQQDVIRGYTILLGQESGNQSMAVIINISLEKQTETQFQKFEAAVRRHPEIQECFLMTGESDYMLRVNAESGPDFERIHNDVLSKLPGVQRIHSSFSIRNVLTSRSRATSAG
ncbi:hypothetical protein ABENE_11335 [Asticcacaulis benevestitus DSM 16100 = ATCC BAA-896]|uniref:HTH asnC-type domain-containing protein n=2 Tax=Asticcacaulis TaxID=76890 RepID=V4PAV2_9CAUL|nr:hypothetical protein ABENE_11335 [Asticcacaulis benevestitus DSM 16100 = ATCC BAA-896]